jgi:hypothetical protein
MTCHPERPRRLWAVNAVALAATRAPAGFERGSAAAREKRRFERAHLGCARVAQVVEPEQVLDRAQQREVVVRFLADRVRFDER